MIGGGRGYAICSQGSWRSHILAVNLTGATRHRSSSTARTFFHVSSTLATVGAGWEFARPRRAAFKSRFDADVRLENA